MSVYRTFVMTYRLIYSSAMFGLHLGVMQPIETGDRQILILSSRIIGPLLFFFSLT
jgi:hypothetical protein